MEGVTAIQGNIIIVQYLDWFRYINVAIRSLDQRKIQPIVKYSDT